jgi:hypothetical protein
LYRDLRDGRLKVKVQIYGPHRSALSALVSLSFSLKFQVSGFKLQISGRYRAGRHGVSVCFKIN